MGGFGIVFRYFSMTYCIYTIDGIVALFIDCFSKAKTKHWTKLSANWKFLVVDKLTHRNQSWKRTESFNNIYRIIWYEVSKTSETERQASWERVWETSQSSLFVQLFSCQFHLVYRSFSIYLPSHTQLYYLYLVFLIIIRAICVCVW